MHKVVPTHDQVQLLSCISYGFSKCPKLAVPESSNSLVLHAPSSLSSLWRCSNDQSCGLTPFDQSVCHIKSNCFRDQTPPIDVILETLDYIIVLATLSPCRNSEHRSVCRVSRNHHRHFRTTSRVCCKRAVKLNHRNVLQIHHLFGVFSVRALGRSHTIRTMCGFVGLTMYFYLDLLKCVLILTMDILLNSLLSFMVLLCLVEGSFPILFLRITGN